MKLDTVPPGLVKDSHLVPSWGLDGWDLGRWSLVMVMHGTTVDGRFLVAERVEGDITVEVFDTEAERDARTDQIAAYWWRDLGHGPKNLPPVGPLQPEHRGPFSWERLDASKVDDPLDTLLAVW